MTAETEPAETLADLVAAFDPECVFRAVALTLAVQTDAIRGHQAVLSVAASYYDWIDPWGLDDTSFKLKLERKQ